MSDKDITVWNSGMKSENSVFCKWYTNSSNDWHISISVICVLQKSPSSTCSTSSASSTSDITHSKEFHFSVFTCLAPQLPHHPTLPAQKICFRVFMCLTSSASSSSHITHSKEFHFSVFICLAPQLCHHPTLLTQKTSILVFLLF